MKRKMNWLFLNREIVTNMKTGKTNWNMFDKAMHNSTWFWKLEYVAAVVGISTMFYAAIIFP